MTYYEILGISKTASSSDIKKSYFALVKQYHPDHNSDPDAVEKFKKISKAYATLKDPQSRKEYDSGLNKSGGFSFFDQYQFNDLDIYKEVELAFLDPKQEQNVSISVETYKKCEPCSATGVAVFGPRCSSCRGQGKVKTVFRNLSSHTICKECSGYGKQVIRSCDSCQGKKLLSSTERLALTIPKGVKPDHTLTIPNRGKVEDGRTGNLLVKIRIQAHSHFKRQNYDVHSTLKVNILDLLSEDNLSFDTIWGLKRIETSKIKLDTPTIVNGLGFPKTHGLMEERGAHYLTVIPLIPQLNPQAKNFIKKARNAIT